MKYCPRCGMQNADTNIICPNCGAALQTPTTAQPNMNPTQPPVAGTPGRGLAIAALICSIFSLVCLALAPAIAGLILSNSARNKGFVGGMNTAARIISIIGIVLSAIFLVVYTIFMCVMLSEIMSNPSFGGGYYYY